MSLDVMPDLLAAAQQSAAIDDDALVETVRRSLPYAYDTVARLVGELDGSTMAYADNQDLPSDEERGQLLRAMASDAIRGALERRFGVALAFQNCHRVAVFPAAARGSSAHAEFTSTRAQILNQSPELRNC